MARPATTTAMVGAEPQAAVPATRISVATMSASRVPSLRMRTELPALPTIDATA